MRKAWIAGGVVAVVGLGLVAVPYVLDWNWFKPRLVASVEAATGYKVAVARDVSFGLLPRPNLSVEQVTVTGFGAERAPLIRADRLSGAVAFWPLLRRKVEVQHVELVKPVVHLVTYADGSTNWARSVQKEEGEASTSGGLSISDFRIKDGTLIQRSASGSETRLDDINLRLSITSLEGPYALEGSVRWGQVPLDLDLSYGDKGALSLTANIKDTGKIGFKGRLGEAVGDAPMPVAGQLTLEAAKLDDLLAKFREKPVKGKPAPAMLDPFKLATAVSGTTEALQLTGVSGTAGGSRIGGDLKVGLGDVTSLSGRLVADQMDAARWMSAEATEEEEPFELPKGIAADVVLNVGKLSYGKAAFGAVTAPVRLADQTLHLGRTALLLPGGGGATVEGVLDAPSGKMRFNGAMTANLPRPAVTLAAFEVDAPPQLPPLSFSTSVGLADDLLQLSGLRGRFDGAPIEASLRYPMTGVKPIDVKLVAERINADRLTGGPDSAKKDVKKQDKTDQAPIHFDIAVGQLQSGKSQYAGIHAVGTYSGTLVTLAQATVRDAMGFSVAAKGRITDLDSKMRTDLAVSLASPDGKGAITVKGPLDRMDVKGSLGWSGATIAIDGWARTEPATAYDLAVNVAAREAGVVLASKGEQPQQIGPLSLAMRVVGQGDRTALNGINGSVGPMKLTGSASVDTAGAKPVINATLKAGDVPLTKLMGASDAGAKQAVVDPKKRWSREPIGLDWIEAFSGRLVFNADRLTYGDYVLGSPVIVVASNGQRATLEKFDATLFGGSLSIKGGLTAGAMPNGTLAMTMTNVPVEPLLKSSAAMAPATGTLNLKADLVTRGRSQQEMIGNLSGPVRISAENGVIRKIDLNRLNKQLEDLTTVNAFIQLAGAALKGGETNYKSLSADLTGKNGRFDIAKITSDMEGGTATGRGYVDLPDWAVDMTAQLQLGSYDDAPRIPATIKGVLNDPVIKYDLKQISVWFGKRVALAGLKGGLNKEGIDAGALLGIKKTAPATATSPETETPQTGEQATPTTPEKPKSVEEELGDVLTKGLGKLLKKKSAPAE